MTITRQKPPPKTVLLQLQRLYKTDERIGARLGNVPAYLIAYWRRKKGIPRYSLPKFSEQEIRNVWERFGDDEKAGLELGISKAAFYNWRRRYDLRIKPAFLKLEQLEFEFPGARMSPSANALWGKRTMARKILARLANRKSVDQGEIIHVEPDIFLATSEGLEAVTHFHQNSGELVSNPGRIILSLGEQNGQENVAELQRKVREFARRQRIKTIYDQRDGNGVQTAIEQGQILPGQLIAMAKNASQGIGCLAALTVSVETELMAKMWRGNTVEMTVPASLQLNIVGRRSRGVYAADVAMTVIDKLKDQSVKGKVLEFSGSVLSQMSINERNELSSLLRPLDLLAVLCPYDATVRRWLAGRTVNRYTPALPDKDAEYDERYQVNIDQLLPQISGPDGFRHVRPVAMIEQTPVQVVVIGSCDGCRFDELRVAANILKGKKVHADCRLFIIPGTRTVYLDALKKGLIRVFIEANAVVATAAFSPCGSQQTGWLAAGERMLITGGAHMTDRIERKNTEIFLCSPATAAASALNGVITDPVKWMQ